MTKNTNDTLPTIFSPSPEIYDGSEIRLEIDKQILKNKRKGKSPIIFSTSTETFDGSNRWLERDKQILKNKRKETK